jgi:hypothetical protein
MLTQTADAARQHRQRDRLAADWVQQMRDGNFEGAWRISDRLRRLCDRDRVSIPRHVQTIWDGRPIDGARVLVRCYHGLGDTIQFIRYAPLLRARAREVIVWAQPALLRLLQTVKGIDRLLPLHDGEVDADYDVDVEVMEFPYMFRTLPRTLPASVPYLQSPPAPLPSSGRPAVGIVWQAGDWAQERSMRFEDVAPLFSIPVDWYILQARPALDDCPSGLGTVCGTDSIDEAAQVIRALDLLITVDSMPAHLAGALATRVWTMLPATTDWRWMTTRSDSPWYPTMRLIRQTRDGDWSGVVARVAQELRRRWGRG